MFLHTVILVSGLESFNEAGTRGYPTGRTGNVKVELCIISGAGPVWFEFFIVTDYGLDCGSDC